MMKNASPIPLYHQVSLVLRHRILDGMFDEHGMLPTEKQLEAEFGVSRISVRKAVEVLVSEGLVERKAGRGTLITQRAACADVTTSHGPFENLLTMGYSTDVDVLEFGLAPACSTVARALEIAPGTEVQRSVRVRSHKGQPFSYLTTWIPSVIGATFDEEKLHSEPLLRLLEEAGARPERAWQSFSAASADPPVARALDVAVSSPLLSILRIVRDVDDRPVEYLEALYRPDRYRYISALSRNSELDGPSWLTTPEDRT